MRAMNISMADDTTVVNPRENAAVTSYWLDHYVTEAGLCGLCGNTGVLDTRGRAISPVGVEAGGRYACICPNGQARRAVAGTARVDGA
jgi:hypothetical protein